MDRITENRRSWNMSRIKGKDTKPEILVRKHLYCWGIRYRLHVDLPGKPDIVIRRKKAAIFVNGCFWHGHKRCKDFRLPKTNTNFWREKIGKNIDRDKRNYRILRNQGWHVFLVWACEIKGRSNRLERLVKELNDLKS